MLELTPDIHSSIQQFGNCDASFQHSAAVVNSGLFSVTIFEVGNIYRGIQPPHTVMHGIFEIAIAHSGKCYRGTQPHGNERHFLDGNPTSTRGSTEKESESTKEAEEQRTRKKI